MFLLKRKKDGQFWNNSGRRGGDAWVSDPSTCRPFRTAAAVRHSRACYGIHPSFGPALRYDTPKEERDAYWLKQHDWYAASNQQGRTDYFNSKYEVIPVRITMELK